MTNQKTINTGFVLLATILASGMAFLMGTSVSIALPTIQSELDTSIAGLQWIINSYVLTLAVLILISGSLGDHFGRKKIFSYGIIVFVIGAMLSGFSDTVEKLITFQALQGIGAAMMIPGSLAIINSCIPEKKRGRAIGLWAGLSGGIAAIGPLAGGWLVETLGWPFVFFINLPLGIVTLLFTYRFVPESRNPESRSIDWLGTIFIGVALFGISFALINGPIVGWTSMIVIIGLIGGIISFITFIIVETRVSEPLVPFKIFKNPLVTGANIATLLLYFALNGVIFFLVLNFQQFQDYSPIFTGLGLLPPIVIITFFSGPAGSLADRIGPRPQMIIGPIIVAVGMALLAIPGVGANYFIEFLPGLVLFGVGMALVIAPLTKSALSVDQKFSGVASGINNAVARIAALLAIAILGAVVVSIFISQLEGSIQNSGLTLSEQSQILSQSEKLGDINVPETFGETSRVEAINAIDESFIHGFRLAMIIGALMAFLSAIVGAITIKNPK